MAKPTVHITNWSSRLLHGPGIRWTIMCKPREWERGSGRVPACTPLVAWFDAVRAGAITLDEYRSRMLGRLAQHGLAPGELTVIMPRGAAGPDPQQKYLDEHVDENKRHRRFPRWRVVGVWSFISDDGKMTIHKGEHATWREACEATMKAADEASP